MEGSLSDIQADVFYQVLKDVEVKDTVPQVLFINELPEDVLREIFVFTLGKSCVPRISAPPLLFFHICKYWRNVALSEPRLWTGIEILVDDDHNKLHLLESREFGSARWIHRAQNLPKNIRVTSSNVSSNPILSDPGWRSSDATRDLATIRPMNLVMFTGSFSSCRQLVLRFSKPGPFHFYFQPRNVDMTPRILESFELLCHFSDPIIENLVAGIRNATCLRRLTLGIPSYQLFNFDTLWGQITHLNLIRVRLFRSEWLPIIGKTGRLEKGAFLLHLGPENIRETRVTLPHLTHLIIRSDWTTQRPFQILGYMDVPALVYFKIARTCDPCFLESRTLSPLQHLQTLCLLRVDFTTNEILNLLQTATMLQALTLTTYPDGADPQDYLRFLVYSEEKGHTLVPRLKTLCLSLEPHKVYAVLADIIASRQSIRLDQQIYALRRLTLFEYSPPDATLSEKVLLAKTRQFVNEWKGVLSVIVKPEKYEIASISAKIPWAEADA